MYKFRRLQVVTARGEVWKKIGYDKFVAFIGLTLVADVEKTEKFSCGTFSFRSVQDIWRLLRFDYKQTRAENLKTD